ncbi:MAG: hypothetical protein ACKV2T_08450 [Kofleriaceae bacterium]
MAIDMSRLVTKLADAGLDLVHAFDANALGELARVEARREENDARSPDAPEITTNRDGSQRMVLSRSSRPLARWARLTTGPRLGLLVANTRALWPHFVDTRRSPRGTNPLDTYVECSIEGALREGSTSDSTPASSNATIYLSHARYDGGFLPFQLLADRVGFASLTDAGLAIHPTFGPWFALRAVIALEPPPAFAIPPPAPIAKPCVCTGACEAALANARADLRDWRAWLAVRDACSLREHRYSDEQIRFHYASAWPKAARDQ